MGKICLGWFFIEWWKSDKGCCWPLEPFSKLKTTFCTYWTSIKIKVSMTCEYKEYEVKIQIVPEQWLQLKMKFLLGYNMKIVTWWEGTNFWCGGKNLMGEVYWGTFPSGGMSKFLACEGGIPSIPPVQKTLLSP